MKKLIFVAGAVTALGLVACGNSAPPPAAPPNVTVVAPPAPAAPAPATVVTPP